MATKHAGIFLTKFPLIHGMSVDAWISDLPTPASLNNLCTDEKYSQAMHAIDRAFIVEANRWGKPYGYIQEQNGARVQNLFPIKQHESDQISSSSKVTLEMHTETAFHPYKPETLVLLCIREDASAGTTYSTLPEILEHLSPMDKEELKKPQFSTSLDDSFKSDRQPDKQITMSILSTDETQIVFDRALMTSEMENGQRALNALINAVNQTKHTIFLKTGEMLGINNRIVVHGRTPFSPRYDGTDRWIKRALVRHTPPPQDQLTTSGIHQTIITTF